MTEDREPYTTTEQPSTPKPGGGLAAQLRARADDCVRNSVLPGGYRYGCYESSGYRGAAKMAEAWEARLRAAQAGKPPKDDWARGYRAGIERALGEIHIVLEQEP